MITRWSKLALMALCLAGTAMVPATSQATSFADLSLEQFTDASTYIVRGEVLETWAELDDRGMVWTRARVQVSKTFKGPDSPNELVITSIGGVYGAHTVFVPGMASYSPGERVLLFLSQTDDGQLKPVSMFKGKMTIRRAPGESRHHLVTWQVDGPGLYDHRFLPHPKAESRIFLDQVIDQVERRVAVGWDGQPIPGLSLEKLSEINTPDRRIRR